MNEPRSRSAGTSKPYRKPVLSRYGRIEAVTTGGTGAAQEGKAMGMAAKMVF